MTALDALREQAAGGFPIVRAAILQLHPNRGRADG